MEKKSFFSRYAKLWTRAFDFEGKSDQNEYSAAVIVEIFVWILGLGCWFANYMRWDESRLLAGIIIGCFGYLVLTLIPFLALTVRRLRDAGKSAWWAGPVFVCAVGVVILMFLGTVDSVEVLEYNPSRNVEVALYDCPDIQPNSVPFQPEHNMEVTVYGPPEFFEQDASAPEE